MSADQLKRERKQSLASARQAIVDLQASLEDRMRQAHVVMAAIKSVFVVEETNMAAVQAKLEVCIYS